MSLFSCNIFTGISFSFEAFLKLRFSISVTSFFFLFRREFVTGCFHTFFDTDYTGMLRELFNAR